MKDQDKLPEEILDAIKAGRKIDAIKLLRAHLNLGLTEAKGIVDELVKKNKDSITIPDSN